MKSNGEKRHGIGKIIINPLCLRLCPPPKNRSFLSIFQVNSHTISETDERRGVRRNLPFSVTIGFLENVVATINVHYTVLEVKLPAVSAPCNLPQRKSKEISNTCVYFSRKNNDVTLSYWQTTTLSVSKSTEGSSSVTSSSEFFLNHQIQDSYDCIQIVEKQDYVSNKRDLREVLRLDFLLRYLAPLHLVRLHLPHRRRRHQHRRLLRLKDNQHYEKIYNYVYINDFFVPEVSPGPSTCATPPVVLFPAALLAWRKWTKKNQ